MKKRIWIVGLLSLVVAVSLVSALPTSASPDANEIGKAAYAYNSNLKEGGEQSLRPPDSGDEEKEEEEERELEAIRAAINAKGARWTPGRTSVFRLSPEEKRSLCGLKWAPKEFYAAGEKKEETQPVGQYSSSLDWRNNNGDWTTPIRDQGTCGSCWAFGSLAALEAQIDIAANDPSIDIELLEQYMLSCSAGGCDGWYQDDTMNFLRDTGTTDEACFAYGADDTIPCGNACPYCAGRNWRIASWSWVSGGTPTTDEIKAYLQDRPLVTGFRVYADFYSYAGGVYEYSSGELEGGHMVAVVGWQDNPPEGGSGCWICKNSWGTNWGETADGEPYTPGAGDGGWFRIRWGEDGPSGAQDYPFECYAAYSTFTLSKRAISCDSGGIESDLFAPGQGVYVKVLGLSPSTDYNIWIQSNPVAEGSTLDTEDDPSGSQESVTTDANGNLSRTLIWSIPVDAPITHHEYDIILDNQEAGNVGTYNAADDGIDDASVAGIAAPIPEANTLVLLMTGLLCI